MRLLLGRLQKFLFMGLSFFGINLRERHLLFTVVSTILQVGSLRSL